MQKQTDLLHNHFNFEFEYQNLLRWWEFKGDGEEKPQFHKKSALKYYKRQCRNIFPLFCCFCWARSNQIEKQTLLWKSHCSENLFPKKSAFKYHKKHCGNLFPLFRCFCWARSGQIKKQTLIKQPAYSKTLFPKKSALKYPKKHCGNFVPLCCCFSGQEVTRWENKSYDENQHSSKPYFPKIGFKISKKALRELCSSVLLFFWARSGQIKKQTLI